MPSEEPCGTCASCRVLAKVVHEKSPRGDRLRARLGEEGVWKLIQMTPEPENGK